MFSVTMSICFIGAKKTKEQRAMGSFKEPESFLIIEPCPVVPIYCSGLVSADVVDNAVHYTFFVNQPDGDGVSRVINLRVIMGINSALNAATFAVGVVASAVRKRSLTN